MAEIIGWKRARRRRWLRRLSSAEQAVVLAGVLGVAVVLDPQGARDLARSIGSAGDAMLADLDRAAITSAPDAPAVLHAPFASSPTPAADLVGPARVIDGDTLAIDGQRIRLHGVDAFERRQTCGGRPCGEEGRRALQALTAGRQVSCRSLDIDRYGRTIARCRADGRDLGAEMVRSGHALAYERYSIDYVDEERAARSAGAGAWAHGDFIVPEDYRHGG